MIPITGNNFESEKLGPSTIVGSASFNLLAISAVCIAGVPTGEIRRIKAFPVFIITSFFSVFAYIWIVIVLVVSTPDKVYDGAGNKIEVKKSAVMTDKDRKKAIKDIEKKIKDNKKKKLLTDEEAWELEDKLNELKEALKP